MLLPALDEQLVLTTQQRAKLVQSLSANYEHEWDQFFEMFAFSNQGYLPSIRDESIVQLLDERQKSVWGQAMKLNGNAFFGQVLGNFLGLGGNATEIQEIAAHRRGGPRWPVGEHGVGAIGRGGRIGRLEFEGDDHE